MVFFFVSTPFLVQSTSNSQYSYAVETLKSSKFYSKSLPVACHLTHIKSLKPCKGFTRLSEFRSYMSLILFPMALPITSLSPATLVSLLNFIDQCYFQLWAFVLLVFSVKNFSPSVIKWFAPWFPLSFAAMTPFQQGFSDNFILNVMLCPFPPVFFFTVAFIIITKYIFHLYIFTVYPICARMQAPHGFVLFAAKILYLNCSWHIFIDKCFLMK